MWIIEIGNESLDHILYVQMEDLSSETQEVLRKKMGDWPDIASKHVSGAMASRITPWGPPTLVSVHSEGVHSIPWHCFQNLEKPCTLKDYSSEIQFSL